MLNMILEGIGLIATALLVGVILGLGIGRLCDFEVPSCPQKMRKRFTITALRKSGGFPISIRYRR